MPSVVASVLGARALPRKAKGTFCTISCKGQFFDTLTLPCLSLAPRWDETTAFEMDTPERRNGSVSFELRDKHSLSLGSVTLELCALPMVKLPSRWYALEPPGTGFVELQVYWNTGPPVAVSPTKVPELQLRSPLCDTQPEPEPEPEPEAEHADNPFAFAQPVEAIETASGLPVSAAQQLALAGIGRQASNGHWCGVRGAVMSPLMTVVDIEWREDCGLSDVTLDVPHGGRVGDAVGVSVDCVVSSPDEQKWCESGFSAEFNVHLDFFNCRGDASEKLSVGTQVMMQGETFTIQTVTPNLDSAESWVQLDRVHQLMSTRTPVLVCEEAHVLDPPQAGGDSHFASGFKVCGNAHQSWFHVKADASTVMFVGQHIHLGNDPTAAPFMIEAINFIPSKLETFIQLDRVHSEQLQLNDQIYLVVQHLDRRFVHSGCFLECADAGNSKIVRVAKDMRQMIVIGTQIQIAYLPAYGNVTLTRSQKPRVKEMMGELVFDSQVLSTCVEISRATLCQLEL